MTYKKSSAESKVAIAAKDVTTDGAKVGKFTTYEELARVHKGLTTTEKGEVILSDSTLCNLSAGRTYKFNEFIIKVIEKRTQFGSGNKTVLSGTINGEPFDLFSIEDIKEAVKCGYRRAKDGSNNSKSPLAKMLYQVERMKELNEEVANEEVAKAYKQLQGILGLLRKEEIQREQKEREEREKAEREAKKTARADEKAQDMSNEALLAELKKRGLI